MEKVSLIRIIAKDLIDFLIIFSCTVLLTLGIYYLLPSFTKVSLSFYFFEQFIELLFVNPSLVPWLFGFGFGVSIIYFLFCAMLYQTTVGGLALGLVITDGKTTKPISLPKSVLLAIGAYCGVTALFISPLWAWWLDSNHRGWSEKLSGTFVVPHNQAK